MRKFSLLLFLQLTQVAGVITKKRNKDAMAHKAVLDQNKKDHDVLVIIANLPVLDKCDLGKYNAIVRKENQKPPLLKKTKKIMDKVYIVQQC